MKYAQNHQGSFPDLEDVAVEEAAKSCKLGMKPEDVQHHYNLWSQDGKYDEVGKLLSPYSIIFHCCVGSEIDMVTQKNTRVTQV